MNMRGFSYSLQNRHPVFFTRPLDKTLWLLGFLGQSVISRAFQGYLVR